MADYKPGDVVNGHVLGNDGVWHPVTTPPATPSAEGSYSRSAADRSTSTFMKSGRLARLGLLSLGVLLPIYAMQLAVRAFVFDAAPAVVGELLLFVTWLLVLVCIIGCVGFLLAAGILKIIEISK